MVMNEFTRHEIWEDGSIPRFNCGHACSGISKCSGRKTSCQRNLRLPGSDIFHPSTTFRLVHDTVSDVVVKVPSTPPPAVLVRNDRGSSAVAMPGCSDAKIKEKKNIFPLFFDAQAYNPCNISLSGSIAGVPRSLSLRIQQFPLVCAVASTVYKVEGENLNAMVETEWRSKNKFANKREQPCLLVSRVTARSAFRTLQPMTQDIIAWARPPQLSLDEEARLEQLSCQTIASIEKI
ncbi:unnamed protein product [Phytophthora lilii]|uniref:Unnamed protein product n=1 Tax=Phytophthora lilii TaxID=2077276 RepID=A0A9W6X4V2_9STRA|nr:unnamed protein product [Phytophthora lilii]